MNSTLSNAPRPISTTSGRKMLRPSKSTFLDPGSGLAVVHNRGRYSPGNYQFWSQSFKVVLLRCDAPAHPGPHRSASCKPPVVFLYPSTLPVRNFDCRSVVVWPVPFVVYLDAESECCQ